MCTLADGTLVSIAYYFVSLSTRQRRRRYPWVPTLEGWPAAIIEAAIRTSLPWRQRTTSYRFNFHKVSKAGWKDIEDDVDRYCPDRELILRLYEEADRLMHR